MPLFGPWVTPKGIVLRDHSGLHNPLIRPAISWGWAPSLPMMNGSYQYIYTCIFTYIHVYLYMYIYKIYLYMYIYKHV